MSDDRDDDLGTEAAHRRDQGTPQGPGELSDADLDGVVGGKKRDTLTQPTGPAAVSTVHPSGPDTTSASGGTATVPQ